MSQRFEDEYMDVLQNIEFAIVQVYNQYPDLIDRQVEKALEGLLRTYKAQTQERPAPALKLSEVEQQVYDSVKGMCDWRTGEAPLERDEEDGSTTELAIPEPITIDEIMACLKRIRKSVNFWTRESGRQGYLEYVSQFIA